jgi:ribosomal protein S18 acetylase RimI-like enzyme
MFIQRADLQDAAEILALQKTAYLSEAAIYDDYAIPPLVQTLEEMGDDLRTQVVLKVVIGDKIVGSVRAYQEQETCHIGRLIVHPDVQSRGIGTRLMHEIEVAFGGVRRFELFTGSRSERNLYLYRKLGYEPFKRQQISDAVTIVFLEKHVPHGQMGDP